VISLVNSGIPLSAFKNIGEIEMADGFRNYDRWKLMSPEDEADERELQRQKTEDDMERADVMRDRKKDEREERRQEADMEMKMMHGGE
jgi:hypothetical protein